MSDQIPDGAREAADNEIKEEGFDFPKYEKGHFVHEYEQSATKALRDASGFCEKHKPTGGVRNCLVCGAEELSHALSRISYACETPNEMGVSEYDTHCNPDAVLNQVKALRERLANFERVAKELAAALVPGSRSSKAWMIARNSALESYRLLEEKKGS